MLAKGEGLVRLVKRAGAGGFSEAFEVGNFRRIIAERLHEGGKGLARTGGDDGGEAGPPPPVGDPAVSEKTNNSKIYHGP